MATTAPHKGKPKTLALAISLLKTDPDAALVPEEREIDSIVENGQHFSPYDVKQSENDDEGQSIAELEDKSFRVRVPHRFKLHSKELGNGPPEASCEPEDGATIEISPADTEHTYWCQIVPKKIGEHTLSFQCEGEHVTGSPVHVKVFPRGDAFRCRLVETTSECQQEAAPVTHSEHDGGSEPNTPPDVLFCVSTKGAGMGVLTASVKSTSTKKFIPTTTIKQCRDDHFHVEFLSSKGTEYIMGLKYDQQHIHGSPFRVIVSDASQCHSEGEGLSVARVNTQNTFSVYTKNAGPGELSAAVQGEEGESLEATITAITETHHEVAYRPSNVGKYTISLLWSGEDIPGSPFTVQCYKPDSEKCAVTKVEVPQESKKPATIHVDASQASDWQLEAQAVGDKAGPAKVEIKEEGDKKFVILLQSSTSDYYNVSITWGGEPIPESPLRLNLHHPSSKEVVVAEPPNASLQTGQAVKICFGTSNAGRGTLMAKCKSRGTSIPVDVTQRKNDRSLYDVQFTPPDADIYHLKVKWAGKPVRGSPFVIDLRPVYAHSVKVTGPNMPKGIKGPVEMGISTEKAGNAQVTAKCIGSKAGQVPLNLKKISEHNYKLSFNPPQPDIYTLSVKYGGQHIMHSPFYINTMPADPSQVKVIVPKTLELSRLLHYKCDVLQAGTGSLTATCQGEEPGEAAAIKVSVTQEGPTKYDISFMLEQAGIYYLSIQWTDKEVPGSPFVLNLTPQADKVRVGELHIPPKAGTDDPVWVELDCSEARYGVVKGVAIGSAPDEPPSEVLVEDQGNDQYRVKFQPRNPDTYTFSVHYGDRHVQGSPFSIDLISPQPDRVKLTGTSIPDEANEPVELSFDTSNAGKSELTAKTTRQSSVSVPTQVEEISSNQYKVSFTPPDFDIYQVHVFWANEKISGSPFLINTIPPNADNVRVTEPESYDLLQLVHYKVDASEAGNGELSASCRGDRFGDVAAVPLNITEEGIAQHDLSFMPHHPDIYKLSIQWSEKDVPGSPFKINLLPAEADKVKVTDFYIPDEAGTGEPVWVDLDCANAGHGVLISTVKGTLTGKTAVQFEKLGNDKHKVTFQPNEPDLYYLSIYYGDSHIPGSPFSINLMLPHPDLVEHTGTTVPKKHGNPVELSFDTSDAGKGELSAQITDQSFGSVRTIVAEVSPNQYKVSFTPPHPDIFQVQVLWEDEEIRGSPFRINLLPPDVNKVKVTEPASYELLQPVHYKVDAFDAGNGNLAAICKGEDIALVHLNMIEEDIGQYDLSFTPRHPDFYTLSIEWSGRQVHGSPFKVNLLPAEADKVQVLDMHIPDRAGTVEPVMVDLDCSDAGHGVLRADARGKITHGISAEIDKLENDEYQVKFLPKQPDMYSLSIYYSKTHIPGSPFSINLLLPQPDRVKHTGTSVPNKHTDPVTLSFDTSDAGKGKLTAQIRGQSAGSVETDIIKVSPNHFKVSFTPPQLDIFQVHVFWADEKINGSPFRINMLPPDVSKVEVTEPESYELLQPVHYKVDAFDAGNGKLTATCKGEDIALVHLNMIEEDIGQYDLSFTPHHPDLYKLSIHWSGRQVHGSPFKVNLLPAEADKVQVLDMHTPDRAGTVEPVTVDLDCSDAGHGVLRADARGKLTHGISAEINKLENDEYQVKFLPKQPDMYSLSIYYNDSHIPGSPFSINLLLPQPDLVEHTGTTVPQEQGEPATLSFDTSEAGRGNLTAYVTGDLAGEQPSEVEEVSPSKHEVTFVPPRPDAYQVNVLWADKPVKDSPFMIKIIDSNNVECGEPSYTVSGKPVELEVKTILAGPGTLSARCSGEKCGETPVKITSTTSYSYNVSFKPTREDVYLLTVYFEGIEVKESPFEIDLVPRVLLNESADMQYLEQEEDMIIPAEIQRLLGASPVDTESEGETDEPLELNIFVGEPVSLLVSGAEGVSDATVVASVTGEKTGPGHVKLSPNPDGMVEIYFDPDKPDHYTLEVEHNGQPIPDSPFLFHYVMPVDPSKCYIFGLENIPTSPQVNVPISLGVDAQMAGDAVLKVTIEGPKSKAKRSKVIVRSEDENPHIYNISLLPTAPGIHLLHLLWANKPVPGSPVKLEVGGGGAAQSYPLGKPFVLEIKADCSLADLSSYAIHETSSTQHQTKIEEIKKNKFKIIFEPQVPGTYAIHILLGEEEIVGCPYHVTFTALANEQGCRVIMPNSRVRVGELLTLTVDVSDAGMGGLFVQSSVPPGGKDSKLTVQESEHVRAYTINYIPNIAGVHHLFILWGGNRIPGCPFQITVLDECDPDITHPLRGDATNLVEVGQRIKVVASVPKSMNDNDFLVAKCMGKNSGEVEVISRKEEKSQTICFVPSVPDDYALEVTFKSNPIEGSPFLIKAVEKDSLAADCVQPNSSTVEAGKMVNLIARVDEAQTTSDLAASTESPIGPCKTLISSEAAGISSIRFFPNALGAYLVHIKEGDSEIPGSPLRVVADSNASKVFIVEEDRQLFQASLPLKDTVSFRISTADAGHGRLDFRAIGPGKVVVQVYDNNDGTYTCKLTPSIPGRYHMGIVWNSVHIRGSPYTVNFTSEQLHMMTGLDLQQERFYVGVPHSFQVECVDQNKLLDITCRPPNAAKIHTTPIAGSNLYECSIVPQISGNHEVAVLYDEKHILGSPFNVQFDLRGHYSSTSEDGSMMSIPEHIRAYGSGLQDGYVGQEGNFAIETGEVDVGTLSVRVHGPKGAFKINMRRHPENERTILVRYDPNIAGVYTVDITWSKTHIPGSPFSVNIMEHGEEKLLV